MEIKKILRDNKILGLVLGFVLPIAVITFYLSSKGYDWDFFKQTFKENKSFATGVLTICLVVNGILFGILIQFKRQLTAIGLFIPTAVLGLGLLIYKFLG